MSIGGRDKSAPKRGKRQRREKGRTKATVAGATWEIAQKISNKQKIRLGHLP